MYKVLNSKDDILIFLRIENYENKVWNIDLPALVNSIKQFNHPNKFLIYTQPAIDKNLDFNVSKKLIMIMVSQLYFIKFYLMKKYLQIKYIKINLQIVY